MARRRESGASGSRATAALVREMLSAMPDPEPDGPGEIPTVLPSDLREREEDRHRAVQGLPDLPTAATPSSLLRALARGAGGPGPDPLEVPVPETPAGTPGPEEIARVRASLPDDPAVGD